MKALVFSAVFTFTMSAFAGGVLKTNEAVLREVQMQRVDDCIPEAGNHCDGTSTVLAPVTVGTTKLVVTSKTADDVRLQATETTTWQSGAQLIDVKGVTVQYGFKSGSDSRINVYQVDGNNMGSVQTNLGVTCKVRTDDIICSGVLPNQNKVLLTIGR